MNKIVYIFICFSLFSFSLPDNGETKAIKKIYKYKTFLGCQQESSMHMDKDSFCTLLQQPLCAKDSAGKSYKIRSFEITYAERGLYEDSAGLPIVVTDYQNDAFSGDTVNSYWKKMLQERFYKGDTVYIEHVVLIDANNKYIAGARPLRFICK